MSACEGCPVQSAMNLAQQVLAENPQDAFEDSVRNRKTRQFAIVVAVLDKASTDCKDVVMDDGKRPVCGVDALLNNTLGFLLGKPSIELDGQPKQSGIGFTLNS